MKRLVGILLSVCLLSMVAYGSVQAFDVFDKEGHHLGVYVNDNEIYLPDFHKILLISDIPGEALADVTRFWFYYKTPDCSGTPYVGYNSNNIIFKGPSGDTLYTGSTNISSITIGSYDGGGGCALCVPLNCEPGAYLMTPTEIFKGKIHFPLPIEFPIYYR